MTRAPGSVPSPPVPVLLYHAITETPGRQIAPFAVAPKAFRAQLELLVAAGYRCISFGQLIAERSDRNSVGNGQPDQRRTVVITFDDGYADFAVAALPALLDLSLPSTLYVTTGWLEGGPGREPGPTDRMLSWAELPDLVAAGVEIGAHSHSHPQLDTLGANELRDELVRPKALLEDALGQAILGLAYPHGYNGPRVRRLTRASGYESGAAVRNRVSHPEEDRFRISRLTVTASTTPAELASWLAAHDRTQRFAGRESAATTAWRLYRRGRAVLRGRPGSEYR